MGQYHWLEGLPNYDIKNRASTKSLHSVGGHDSSPTSPVANSRSCHCGPEEVRYSFDGEGGIVEYGEDGLAWIWSQEAAISGEISLPDGRWTARLVLPPCEDSTLEAAGSIAIADLSLSGTVSLESPLWSVPFGSNGSSIALEASATTSECELPSDGRTAFFGLFFEPVDLVPTNPEIVSTIAPDVAIDGMSWIWSTSPELSGSIKLAPSLNGWSIRVEVPGCTQQSELAGSVLSLSVDNAVSVGPVTGVTEVVALVRPTVTSLFSFTASVMELQSCVLPDDGGSVSFRFFVLRL